MTDHTATISAALAPCPFCGRDDGELTLDNDGWHLVQCDACLGCGPSSAISADQAIAAWNKRAHLDTLAAGQEWVPVEHEFSLGTLTTWDDGIEDGDGVSDWWVRINELAAPLYDVRLCQREPRPSTGEATGLSAGSGG